MQEKYVSYSFLNYVLQPITYGINTHHLWS